MDFGVWEGRVPLCERGGGGGHAVGIKKGLVEDSAIERKGSEHNAVHKHPSYKWRSSSFV